MIYPQNIMIVEDEVITQRYLKDILSQNSIPIMGCFTNGEDALEALKKDDCNMILMDINIKGSMDGLRLAKRILDKYSIPIVYITAHSDQETFSEVLELSPYGFISKPFSVKELEIALKVAHSRFQANEIQSENESNAEKVFDIRINDILTYVPQDSTLYYDGQIIKLNQKQTSFVDLLCKNINSVVSNEGIKSVVWGNKRTTDTSLRTLIYTLRKILPDLPLVSHSKLGYSIVSN